MDSNDTDVTQTAGIYNAAPALHATAAPTCSIMQTDPTQDAGLPTTEPTAKLRGLHQSDVYITGLKLNLDGWKCLFHTSFLTPERAGVMVVVYLGLLLSLVSVALLVSSLSWMHLQPRQMCCHYEQTGKKKAPFPENCVGVNKMAIMLKNCRPRL